MKYFSSNLRIVIVLLMIPVIFLTNWLVDNETTELDSRAFSQSITSMDAQFANKKLYLNIHLKQDTSCKEIMSSLAIQSLIVKGKTYSPSCHRIDNSLIRIVYTEAIEV